MRSLTRVHLPSRAYSFISNLNTVFTPNQLMCTRLQHFGPPLLQFHLWTMSQSLLWISRVSTVLMIILLSYMVHLWSILPLKYFVFAKSIEFATACSQFKINFISPLPLDHTSHNATDCRKQIYMVTPIAHFLAGLWKILDPIKTWKTHQYLHVRAYIMCCWHVFILCHTLSYCCVSLLVDCGMSFNSMLNL